MKNPSIPPFSVIKSGVIKKYGGLLFIIPNDFIELKQLMREKFLNF